MNPTASGVKGHAAPSHSIDRRIPYQFRPQPAGVPGLSPTELVIFTAILDDAKRRSWRSRISNAALAAIVGRTTMTVKRCLAALEGRGLIAREFVAGGRIRLAILVTWDGVEHRRPADARPVEHQRSGGGTSGFRGVEHPRSPIQSPIQSAPPDAARSSLGEEEDAASRVAGGPEAAAYLRACVAAGRRGEPMPPPPVTGYYAEGNPSPGVPMVQVPLSGVPTPPKGITNPDTLPAEAARAATAPGAPAVAFTAEVGRMVKALGERLKSEDAGRRRVGPKKLAMQLAEMRRRHARRDRGPKDGIAP